MLSSCPACGASNRIPWKRLHQQARCGSCKAPLPALGKPIEVESSAAFDELVQQSSLPVLVDFWAPWCGPCRMVGPELVKLAGQKQGQVVVAKVNTDRLQNVAARFDISGIPTLILFRGGREARRISGARPAQGIASELGL